MQVSTFYSILLTQQRKIITSLSDCHYNFNLSAYRYNMQDNNYMSLTQVQIPETLMHFRTSDLHRMLFLSY